MAEDATCHEKVMAAFLVNLVGNRFSERMRRYLIRKFAEGGGQSAGEFYTPAEVGIVMARIMDADFRQWALDYRGNEEQSRSGTTTFSGTAEAEFFPLGILLLHFHSK